MASIAGSARFFEHGTRSDCEGDVPEASELFHGKGVTDDEPGETYWKVANRIRLTGMPAFQQSLNETQMWQVSLLLANADKISDAVKEELKPPPPPGAPAAEKKPKPKLR